MGRNECICHDYIIENEGDSLFLASRHSTRVSLAGVRIGRYELNERRKRLLSKVVNTGDYASFELDSINLMDLAYLSAKTGEEFALLRGKHEDILFHGSKSRCVFTNELESSIRKHKIRLVGHSHPGEEEPEPSLEDRAFLKEIGQSKSCVISARTGRITEFTSNPFDI